MPFPDEQFSRVEVVAYQPALPVARLRAYLSDAVSVDHIRVDGRRRAGTPSRRSS